MILISLAIGITMIILLTARLRVHAFFALLLASFVVGLCMQMPAGAVITSVKEGFGNIMTSLGLIIILGTTLGVLLEHTGSTKVLADFILRRTGERRASLAMSITGFIVGLPIFCDSGYIVLSGLNRTLSRRTGVPVIVMSTSLASGLYAVHCLIPPHPGAAAAAGALGVDFGQLILLGIPLAIPAMFTGYWWANYAGRKFVASNVGGPSSAADPSSLPSSGQPELVGQGGHLPINQPGQPPVWKAFLPIGVPILLIAIRSFIVMDKATGNRWMPVFSFLGDPVIALSTGVLLAFFAGRSWNRREVSGRLAEAVEKAGGILVIIGAGGGFGAVIVAVHPGQYFGQMLGGWGLPGGSLGLLFPFLLTALLKTAQGSSTVAIITAASIIQPLLPALGLTDAHASLFCVLSMGAGSMMISHANDAYFWVIAASPASTCAQC
jgi:gluconate:H+ symporter, GntP family